VEAAGNMVMSLTQQLQRLTVSSQKQVGLGAGVGLQCA
jgi:hypothetical protein